MQSIFIQIASYRDPELIPTIKDILQTAAHPERLTFGICHQYSHEDVWDDLSEFKNDPRFSVKEVPWNQSEGLCWARMHTQKMWKGEYWTLQLDSHHRMADNWDVELINMAVQTQSEKPILTSYAGSYDPETNTKHNVEPYRMVAKSFTEYGTIVFAPEGFIEWKDINKPFPARFVSGHYFFTKGIHCQEYNYDPHLYFQGDEISLAVRSYTLGYDLFHPHRTVVWHEYTRKNRVKHWDDFTESNKKQIKKTWLDSDAVSKSRLRQLLQMEDNGFDLKQYGLGTVRSLQDYEEYAGIDFKLKKLHPDTLQGVNPPLFNPQDQSWKHIVIQNYSGQVSWADNWQSITQLLGCTCKLQFIMIAIEDKEGRLLFREDLNAPEFLNGSIKSFNYSFGSASEPILAIVWPYTTEQQWVHRINLHLKDQN